IGGTITYPSARRALAVLRGLPAEWLVLETDAPDLAPAPHRGEVNRPAYLALVAAQVAATRGWSNEETARVTTANALRILGVQGTLS
uniref:TatD family hydrolase n=1 Tax=Trichloromonas sp. TaxID=3069249 RepID=UPI003D812A8B